MRSTLSYVVLALFVCVVCAAPGLAEDVPQLVNIQGLLTDSSDEPIADGTYSVSFAIYDVSAGGSAMWSETRSVTTEGGLFTVILGETNPLEESLFTGTELWLGITVAGDTEMTPRQRLTSVPYALNAPGAGGSGSGWTSDGDNVYLEDENDNVGIGTASPAWKLDVAGIIHSSDSVIAGDLRVGSESKRGTAKFYGDRNQWAYATIMQNGGSSGEGGELHLAGDGGGTAIRLDGNWAGDPRVEITGSSRSVLIDLQHSGDDAVQLPSSSISNAEMYNEPGVANAQTTAASSFTLDGTIKTIKYRRVSFPSAGYAVVLATASLGVSHSLGLRDVIHLGVSDVAGVIPDHQNFGKSWDDQLPSDYSSDMVTVHGYFPVESGQQTFYFLGWKGSGGSVFINDVELTVLFFPTSYAAIFFPTSPEGSDPEDGADRVAPDELELKIAEQVKAETAAIRAEYEAKLAQMKTDLTRQMQEMLEAKTAGR